MIGTEDGFWFAFTDPRSDGMPDYEFYHGDERVQSGICSEAEMHRRFAELTAASQKSE